MDLLIPRAAGVSVSGLSCPSRPGSAQPATGKVVVLGH